MRELVERDLWAVGFDVRALAEPKRGYLREPAAASIGLASWLVVLCALAAGSARADGLDPAALGWPATTRSITAGKSATIWASPGRRVVVGKLARDHRVAWTAIASGDRRCRAWLSLAPRGYVCADDVRPSDDPPSPAGAAAELPLGRYADVRGAEVEVYDSAAAVRAGTPTGTIPGTTFVAVRDQTVKVGGVTYRKTDQGYIAASALIAKTPSAWSGFDPRVEAPPQWPFAWTVPERKHTEVPVRAAPARRAPVVGALGKRDRVPVFEQHRTWTRIGPDQWVETARLRIAQLTAPPPGVAADARWIDVDLDQQTLVAYEGAAPVYVTMVSTGRKKFRTPIGVYRIVDKEVRTRMRNPDESKQKWDVADVPWSMGFRKYFALHGAYWHDGFGTPRSHGCVNLAPEDARHLYGWTGPAVPDGWRARTIDPGDPTDGAAATVVRLRDRRDQDPPWRDFEGVVLPGPPP